MRVWSHVRPPSSHICPYHMHTPEPPMPPVMHTLHHHTVGKQAVRILGILSCCIQRFCVLGSLILTVLILEHGSKNISHKSCLTNASYFYHPQQSWGMVIFSVACVKNSVLGELPWQVIFWTGTPLGRYTPRQVHPIRQVYPWAGTLLRQVYLPGRYNPLPDTTRYGQ